ncbi:MAG: hypothetical protein A2571_00695 [Candidatus Vogelbacteria bacterium RIFOXYD1_FULL_44_32]|uniref:PrgI family protein n=1 Tax=Candidatus Vogelbacteria bacterium RIFOXYD1_FULL_44_32 TaxID=1802438 RepID=A0A1G2QE69_9BACT|nr:MAG: hypothetical protein A2571_00695 [Candidatus Vogelbacteria bacterium RIFOXYD1_FULL_44_32]
MNFQVPQFIEVEDKIFGPLTFKQFLYVAGGIGLAFIFYVFLPSLFLSAIPIALAIGLGAMLAFLKINNRPFIYTFESAIKYYIHSKLYIWNKKPNAQKLTMETTKQDTAGLPRLSDSKLSDLSWSLDVKDKIN